MELDTAALLKWLTRAAQAVEDAKVYLTDLDAAIGDGDHGANLARGFGAVMRKVGEQKPSSPAALLKLTGMTLIGTVGGASGPLYGTLFLEAAKAAGERASLDEATLARCLAAGVAGVRARGKANLGDKTMVDALMPAVELLANHASLSAAAQAAAQGAEATKPLIARKGRASYLGERSIGHLDPGATSAAMLIRALAETVG